MLACGLPSSSLMTRVPAVASYAIFWPPSVIVCEVRAVMSFGLAGSSAAGAAEIGRSRRRKVVDRGMRQTPVLKSAGGLTVRQQDTLRRYRRQRGVLAGRSPTSGAERHA